MYEVEEGIEIKELPWYIKSNWICFFAAIAPPLAYIIVFLNSKKIVNDTKSNYLFFTTLMMSVWLLKFLPHNIFTFIFTCVLCAFSALMLIIKFIISNQNS